MEHSSPTLPEAPVVADFDALTRAARQERCLSENTLLAYQRAWRRLLAWSGASKLDPLMLTQEQAASVGSFELLQVLLKTTQKLEKLGLRLDNRTIEFQHGSPRRMAAAGRMSGLVFAALREIGKANITPERVATLRRLLSEGDRRRLIKDLALAPAWMHPYLRRFASWEGQ